MTKKSSEDFSDRREMRQVHRSALSAARFRQYYPVSWFSSLGAWLLRFLLGWSAWDLTHSATWGGITGALMLAPALLLSPWFGILSDRVNPRQGLRLSMLIHSTIALVGAITTWLAWYDRIRRPPLLGWCLCCCSSLHLRGSPGSRWCATRFQRLPTHTGYSCLMGFGT